MHEYIEFWWQMAMDSDACDNSPESGGVPSKKLGLAIQFEDWRKKNGKCHSVAYSHLIQVIPVLFFLGWLYLIGYNIILGLRYVIEPRLL